MSGTFEPAAHPGRQSRAGRAEAGVPARRPGGAAPSCAVYPDAGRSRAVRGGAAPPPFGGSAHRAVRIRNELALSEATGYTLWFHAVMQKLGHTLLVGEAAKIRAMAVRKTKTDRRDAQHPLDLLKHER